MKTGTPIVGTILFFLMFAAPYDPVYSSGSKTPVQDQRKRYNVMMIVSDALRADVLGCYGGEVATPNIDSLAKSGVLFENAYSTSPWTAPSSVSMFTGNYATTYGYSRFTKTMRIYVPDSELLFTESLRELGYIATMKVENVQASLHNNFQGLSSLPEIKIFNRAVSKQVLDNIKNITGDEPYNIPAYKNSCIVLKHLLDISPEKNFFILHWIIDPHVPYDPIAKFESRIDISESELPKRKHYYSQCKDLSPNMSEVERRYLRGLYAAEVESVDERIGYVLKVLQHKMLIDNTYIVFTADHGEQFGEHGLYGHGGFGRGCHYYEGLMRVPLIIAGPELPKGKRIKDSVSLLDLMPTLKDLLGVEYKDDMQGKSCKSLFFADSRESRFLYFDDVREHDQIDALLENNFKLISSGGNKLELYDLSNDGQERRNLVSSHSDLAGSMYKKLMKIREENKQRRKKNISALYDNMDQLTDVEKRRLIRQLKSLGYVK